MRHTEPFSVLNEDEIKRNTNCLDKLEMSQTRIAALNLKLMEAYGRLVDLRHTSKAGHFSPRSDIEGQAQKLSYVMVEARSEVSELDSMLREIESEARKLANDYK